MSETRLTVTVTPNPNTLPLNTPVTFSVHAIDAGTGATIGARVLVNGTDRGATDAQIWTAVPGQLEKVWVPGDTAGPPSGRVGHSECKMFPATLTIRAGAPYPDVGMTIGEFVAD